MSNRDQFVPFRETQKTSFEIDLKNPGLYWFKLRTKNDCDWGSFSDILSFSVAIVPEKVSGVSISQSNDCNLVVDWEAPKNGGSPIKGYKVELETMSVDSFSTTNIGCGYDPKITSCIIDI